VNRIKWRKIAPGHYAATVSEWHTSNVWRYQIERGPWGWRLYRERVARSSGREILTTVSTLAAAKTTAEYRLNERNPS
jgi:hypothetical protein